MRERQAIGERTRVALAHLRAQNRWPGGHAEYGWRLDDDPEHSTPTKRARRLVPDDAEQAVIAEARRLREAGLSLRAISATLAERGRLARGGRAFGPQALAGILGRVARPVSRHGLTQ